MLSHCLRDLRDKLQKEHISANIWYSMNAGIQSFRQSTDPLLHTSRIEATGHTYEQHTHIGWGNFLKGRNSAEWGHLMLNDYQTFNTDKQYESRQRFQITLITGLWKIYSSLWKHLSTIIHEPTEITHISNTELNTKIRFYFNNRHTLLGIGDQENFPTGPQKKLNISVTRKQNWILTIAHQVKYHPKDTNTLLEQIPTLHTYYTKFKSYTYQDTPPPNAEIFTKLFFL